MAKLGKTNQAENFYRSNSLENDINYNEQVNEGDLDKAKENQKQLNHLITLQNAFKKFNACNKLKKLKEQKVKLIDLIKFKRDLKGRRKVIIVKLI